MQTQGESFSFAQDANSMAMERADTLQQQLGSVNEQLLALQALGASQVPSPPGPAWPCLPQPNSMLAIVTYRILVFF